MRNNSLRDHSITIWTRGGGGQKMFVFVHAQGIKTIHAGRGGKKWQNSVYEVVKCPLMATFDKNGEIRTKNADSTN